MPRDPQIEVKFARGQVDDALRRFAEASGIRLGWTCENYHLNPDTGIEFVNEPDRESCEICGRARRLRE